ncbi:MAG: hypothetical protein KM310_10870 [Clostridiales bacterium]|nr:hypothetical protein [Clostridiales bacterium]
MKPFARAALAFLLTVAVVATTAPAHVFAAPDQRYGEGFDAPEGRDPFQKDLPPVFLQANAAPQTNEESGFLAPDLVEALFDPEVQEWAWANYAVREDLDVPDYAPESVRLKKAVLGIEQQHRPELLTRPFTEDEARQAMAEAGIYEFSDEAIENYNTKGYAARAMYERLKAVGGSYVDFFLQQAYVLREETAMLRELSTAADQMNVKPEAEFVMALGRIIYQNQQEQKRLAKELDQHVLEMVSRKAPANPFRYWISKGVAWVGGLVGLKIDPDNLYARLGGKWIDKPVVDPTQTAYGAFYTGTLVSFNQTVAATDPELQLITALLSTGRTDLVARILNDPTQPAPLALQATTAGYSPGASYSVDDMIHARFFSLSPEERLALTERFKEKFMEYLVLNDAQARSTCEAYTTLGECFDALGGWKGLGESVNAFFGIPSTHEYLLLHHNMHLPVFYTAGASSLDVLAHENLGQIPPRQGWRAKLQTGSNTTVCRDPGSLTNQPGECSLPPSKKKTYLSQ